VYLPPRKSLLSSQPSNDCHPPASPHLPPSPFELPVSGTGSLLNVKGPSPLSSLVSPNPRIFLDSMTSSPLSRMLVIDARLIHQKRDINGRQDQRSISRRRILLSDTARERTKLLFLSFLSRIFELSHSIGEHLAQEVHSLPLRRQS